MMLVIKEILLKRIDSVLSSQQLSRIIDVEMIQKVQVAVFKMDKAEPFNKAIKRLM